MISKYKEIEFPEIEKIDNLEYYKVYMKLEITRIIKKSRKIVPKLKRIIKSKIRNII